MNQSSDDLYFGRCGVKRQIAERAILLACRYHKEQKSKGDKILIGGFSAKQFSDARKRIFMYPQPEWFRLRRATVTAAAAVVDRIF